MRMGIDGTPVDMDWENYRPFSMAVPRPVTAKLSLYGNPCPKSHHIQGSQ